MDRKLIFLLVLFFISFGFFASVIVFNKPITQFTRAKDEVTPSASRSRIVAWPFPIVKADGYSESTINVFVISEGDKPLSNKIVTLITNFGTLRETAQNTDNNGKATFHISSSSPGIAEIQAVVEPSINLKRKISLKFE